MNASAPIETLQTFREFTQQTCLICMGRGKVPISNRDKFGRLVAIRATCLRCNGSGRTDNN